MERFAIYQNKVYNRGLSGDGCVQVESLLEEVVFVLLKC